MSKLKYLSLLQGRIVGITIGCLIGMMPLLFIDTDKKKKDEGEAAVEAAAAPGDLLVAN